MVEKNAVNRKKDIIFLIIGIIIIILVNYIGSFAFERFDLTSEKRYTLSETSKDLARNLDDIVYVKVYLEGDFPAGFKRLRDETKEMLDEFRAYSNGNFEYEFINPSESSDTKIRDKIYKQLYKQGLRPTDLNTKTDDGYSNKIVWPGAIFSYRGKELATQLLKSQIGASRESMLNSSIESLEYEIANSINNLTVINIPKVAFIEGHGELSKLETASLAKSLAEFYVVDRIELNENLNSLTERVMHDSTKAFSVKIKYNAIIIAKPNYKFSEKDKFIIDQYIMYGGRVVWLIDPVFASMDSLQTANITMAIPLNLNLDDQLFTYGVRINTNIVQDLQCVPIPIITGVVGNQPKQEMFPWFFFPLLTPANNHPIVNNLNALKGEFVSSIDTIAKKGIRKTGLLKTSQYSKVSNAPTRIGLDMVRFEPDQTQFNKGSQSIAVLLEGNFESVFKNRITPQIKDANEINFKEESVENKMVVIADGDVAKNYVNKRTGEYFPLGFDRYTRQEFGNKDFMLNVLGYLCDDSGLMSVRSKKLKIRLLDKKILKNDKFSWQLTNTILPIGLVLLFGIAHYFDRKKKFTK
ncbi:MAG: gliding motility-associated ABC transporter substrate-binding protein GldG [Flavobacteriales bacterium]|nr:MAG: gliding motility-associated ABC transporter substrate-binding protein GldG [Flavobacteriales bacterium]